MITIINVRGNRCQGIHGGTELLQTTSVLLEIILPNRESSF